MFFMFEPKRIPNVSVHIDLLNSFKYSQNEVKERNKSKVDEGTKKKQTLRIQYESLYDDDMTNERPSLCKFSNKFRSSSNLSIRI